MFVHTYNMHYFSAKDKREKVTHHWYTERTFMQQVLTWFGRTLVN